MTLPAKLSKPKPLEGEDDHQESPDALPRKLHTAKRMREDDQDDVILTSLPTPKHFSLMGVPKEEFDEDENDENNCMASPCRAITH